MYTPDEYAIASKHREENRALREIGLAACHWQNLYTTYGAEHEYTVTALSHLNVVIKVEKKKGAIS